MTCPSCGNTDIRLSQHSYWGDTFQSIFGRMPYRCRKCRHRFYSSGTPAVAEGPKGSRKAHLVTREELKSKRRRLLRGLIAIAIFAVMFVIFLMILKYLTTDTGPPKDYGAAPVSSSAAAAREV